MPGTRGCPAGRRAHPLERARPDTQPRDPREGIRQVWRLRCATNCKDMSI